jgi:hypothetical protein
MTVARVRPASDRRGVALLTTMMLIILLLVAIVGAFTRTSGEFRTANDQASQVDALALAQSGLDQYLVAQTSLPTTLPDSQVFTMTGGRAVVTLRAVRLSVSDSTYVLISRGENTSTNRYAANTATATRTVAQLLRRSSGSLQVDGAFTSLSGFHKNGTSGTISGVDACMTSPQPSVPGLLVPSKSDVDPDPWYTGPTDPIDGNPDDTPVAIGTPGTSGTAKDAVDIDWAGIVDQTSITPTYYEKTTSPTAGSWPSTTQIGGTNWPITMVTGNKVIDNSDVPGTGGQGILIVTGDLTFNGSAKWNGIVLVGGTILSNGNQTVTGAIFTGLNIKLGIAVPENTLGNGTKTFQYDSCDVTKAMSPFAGWSRMGNATVDNWPSY